MNSLRSLKLILWLPLLVFTLFVALIIFSVLNQYNKLETGLIHQSKLLIRQDMSNLQREMQRNIRKGQWQEAKNALSARGVLPHYQRVIGFNQDNQIFHSTRLSDINKNILDIDFFQAKQMKLSQVSNSPRLIVQLDELKVLAYYPLNLSRETHEISSSKHGGLFLIYDLSVPQALLWKHAWTNSMPIIVALFLLLMSTVIFIKRYIFNLIQHLILVTDLFSRNATNVQSDISGDGEFKKLAEAFNQMVLKRRLYEFKLHSSHEKITQALSELADQKYALDQHSIVAITDIKGTITYVNDKFCQISGFTRDELMGQNHRMLKSGLHDGAFYRQMYQTICKGSVWQGEICNKAKSGNLYWVDTTIVPFMGEDKKPQSYISIRTDITLRVNNEQALKASEERFKLAMSVANDGIWDWDLQTNSVIFDDRYYQMAGYQPGEFPHDLSEWEKRVHPDDIERVKNYLKDYFSSKLYGAYACEFRFRKKDNQYIWILSKAKAVAFDENSMPLRMVGTHRDISLRKASEARWQFALEGARDGVWDWDTETNKVFYSPRWKEMLGYNEDEISDNLEEWKLRIHPDDLDKCQLDLSQHFNGHTPYYENQHRVLCKDGSYKWILDRGKVVSWDKHHKPLRVIGTQQDISVRKKIENSLVEAQKIASLGSWELNILTGELYWSDEIYRILEINRKQFTASYQLFLEVVHPEDKSFVKSSYDISLEIHKPYNIVYRLLMSDGRIKYIHEQFDTSYNKKSQAIRAIGSVLDITQRKKAELALIKNQERMSLLVHTIPYGIQESNLDGVITFSNNAHHKILGWKNNQLVGQSIWDFEVDEKTKQESQANLSYLIKQNPTPESYISKQITKTGTELSLEFVWDYKRDSKGKVLGFISVISDVSAKIKAEKALLGAQKMEAVGQLAGGIAHDFNNILGVIIGNLELLEGQVEHDEKAKRRVTAASKAAERAAKLTRQLLDFSRRKIAESSAVDINRLINNMDDIMGHTLGTQITIVTHLANDLWLTEIDSGDFHDALLNMVINSRDAMDRGGQLTLETSNCYLDKSFCESNAGAIEGDYVRFEIRDNGEGIRDDVIHNIFEPFFTTKIQGKGTGLGLSMVFGFIKRSQGYIKVDSSLNQGTSFTFYLPKSKKLKDENIELKKIAVTQNKRFVPGGRKKILVVDDEKTLVDLVKGTLEKINYQVLSAYNSEQALTHLSAEKNISLVFSDIVMPGKMTGFELAKTIKNLYPETKILLTSGYTGKAEENRSLDNLEHRILAKPYTQLDMLAEIQRLLETETQLMLKQSD